MRHSFLKTPIAKHNRQEIFARDKRPGLFANVSNHIDEFSDSLPRHGNKGEITIMLSLTLMLLLAVVLTIVQGIRLHTSRMYAELLMDLGLDSCFAEYNKQLLEEYDLFFIDSSYVAATPSLSNVSEHLRRFIEDNCETGDLAAMGASFFPVNLNVENTWVLSASIASDDTGEVFKQQAVSYMKDKYGISYINALKDSMQSVNNGGYMEVTLENDLAENNSKVRDAVNAENSRRWSEYNDRINSGEEGLSPPSRVSVDNVAERLDTSTSLLLGSILNDQGNLSEKAIDLTGVASCRTLEQGIGLPEHLEKADGLDDDLLFVQYAAEHFENYVQATEESAESALKYQLEYLIGGKESDRQNLENVAAKLMTLRGGANLAVLMSDASKLSQAEALAAGLCAALPVAQPFVKAALVLVWCYAESALDLNNLLSGNKVPLVKNAATWQLSLDDALHYKDFFGIKKSSSGLAYADYLKILLTLENKNTLVMRSMDVIEIQVRKTEANEYFRIDGAISYMIASAEFASAQGNNLEIKRDYAYE